MTEYTRITFIVADDHVMQIKRMLAAFKVKDVADQPLVNAEMVEGQLVAKSFGNLEGLLTAWFQALPAEQEHVRADDIRAFQLAHGRSPGGYSAALHRAQAIGLIKHVAKSGKGSAAIYKITAKARKAVEA